MSEPEEVLRLRACRTNLEGIRQAVSEARAEQAALERRIDDLLQQQREARQERRAAVLAADAATPKIPRLRIAKEVGMNRGNLYKLLDEGDSDDA